MASPCCMNLSNKMVKLMMLLLGLGFAVPILQIRLSSEGFILSEGHGPLSNEEARWRTLSRDNSDFLRHEAFLESGSSFHSTRHDEFGLHQVGSLDGPTYNLLGAPGEGFNLDLDLEAGTSWQPQKLASSLDARAELVNKHNKAREARVLYSVGDSLEIPDNGSVLPDNGRILPQESSHTETQPAEYKRVAEENTEYKRVLNLTEFRVLLEHLPDFEIFDRQRLPPQTMSRAIQATIKSLRELHADRDIVCELLLDLEKQDLRNLRNALDYFERQNVRGINFAEWRASLSAVSPGGCCCASCCSGCTRWVRNNPWKVGGGVTLLGAIGVFLGLHYS